MQNLIKTKLTKNEINRYSRQIILPEIGVEGQIKLREASVLIIGLGGLGAPVLAYLINTGIQNLAAIDKDKVEIHNLQRQIIYKENQVGLSKSICAFQFVKDCNSKINFSSFEDEVTIKNVHFYLSKFEIIVDCTDDINCRYIVSEYCEKYNKSLILAAVLKWTGHVFVLPAGSACYRCLFKEKKQIVESCDEVGVVGSVCGIIGSIQATEVLKVILGKETSEMIVFDAKLNSTRKMQLRNRIEHDYIEVDDESKKELIIDIEKKTNSNTLSADWKLYLDNPDQFLVVDVRKKKLFEIFSLTNSINVPFCELKTYNFKVNINKFDKSKKILAVCNKGITGAKACKIFSENGFDCCAPSGGFDTLFEILKDF